MLKDITLGQYLPGDSVVHRLDPRTKLLLTIAYVTAVFCITNFSGYALIALFTISLLKIAQIPLKLVIKSLKPLMLFIGFTAVINIFMTGGRPIFTLWHITATYEGLYIALIMGLRLIFLIAGTSLLTYTTSPIVLTDGIEQLLSPMKRIGVPAHELAMMMTIALRFIPTIIEETDKIMKAQSARGASFDTGNIINRARAMIPLLVPLFISAFRRADELALAMECRCYRGGDNRTKMKILKMQSIDYFAYLFVLLLIFAVLLLRRLPV